MILQGGKLYYDTPIGILCLDSQFPKPRGHLRNPLTYPFPTVQYLIRGVDVSSLLSELKSGVRFKNWDGESLGDTVEEQGKAFFGLLAKAGVNWVRLRVWNDPFDENDKGYGGGNCDVKAAKIMGKWATDAGLKVLVDFVPNHVARDYGAAGSMCPDPEMGLGAGDDMSVHWREENDFFYYPGQRLVLPNEDEFNSECNSLREGDFSREYKILPAWLVENCAQIRAGLVKDGEGNVSGRYSEKIGRYSDYLFPYGEFPARATGNAYTPTPGMNDWYETIKINYCDFHTHTWDKMLAVLEFWLDKGVDGFRCDMVELVPPQFFRWAIAEVKRKHPDTIFIAEVYKKDLYKKYVREVGFDFLYDKSGLYDTLRSIVQANVDAGGMPLELWQSAKGISRNWQYLGDLQPYMLNFLENHDEQRFASDHFGKDARNCFAPLFASLYLNRAAFMIYAGEEMGEKADEEEGFSGKDGRTTIFDWWSLKSLRALRKVISSGAYRSDRPWEGDIAGYEAFFRRFAETVRFASKDDAVRIGTTYDLCYCNAASEGFDIDRHFAFLRDSEDETILFAINFSPVEARMKLFIPEHAFEWLEMPQTESLNTSVPVEVTVPPMDAVAVTLCQ